MNKLDPVEYGLSMLFGKKIVDGSADQSGLHLELDDGTTFVIIGTFYAGIDFNDQYPIQ